MVGDQLVHQLHIRHRTLDQRGTRGHVVGLAGEQVVEHRDARAGVDETSRHSRPDKACSARYEDAACPEGPLMRPVGHRFTPVRNSRAGRKSRHQSLRPRIFEYDSAAWYTTVQGCSMTR